MSIAHAKEDTFTNGTWVTCKFFLTSVETHDDDSRIVTVQDWELQPTLRDDIVQQVFQVVERMVQDTTLPHTEELQHPTCAQVSVNIVQNYLFPIKTWIHMLEDERLPKNCQYGRIIFELEANKLKIRELASPAHDAAANSLNVALALWSTNLGLGHESLEQLGQGRKTQLYILIHLIEWYFQAGSETSADQAFRPLHIQVGNNLAKLVPGTNAIIYPTFIIEVAKTYESHPQLLDDAEQKYFSPLTSIQVWLGIKLFSQSERLKVAVKFRSNSLGYGSDPDLFIESETLPIFQPTTLQIIIPKDTIYFAVPQNQIPKTRITIPGRNVLPVPALPLGAIDDFVVPVEIIRQSVARNWS